MDMNIGVLITDLLAYLRNNTEHTAAIIVCLNKSADSMSQYHGWFKSSIHEDPLHYCIGFKRPNLLTLSISLP